MQKLGSSAYWGLIKVPLKVKSFHQLRLQFEEMAGSTDHLGLNILPFSNSDCSKKCLKDRVSLGKHAMRSNSTVVKTLRLQFSVLGFGPG
ncbi:hypothetical protein AVEN_82457-1 [Araneus ventricosus]|uniref:Uncharacterized protein n=1 Tax=Araneus ventricosus TaxID=182803 RepID=A0A4Y2QUZ7_ARAVE|nr:hypothetical protein AVEN_82457-1 [Araneus ventricosus]